MPNLFDYLNWRGDLDFSKSEFCSIDALVFSTISYLDFESVFINTPLIKNISIKELSSQFFSTQKNMVLNNYEILRRYLLRKAAESERYQSIEVSNYVGISSEEKGVQFGALTYHLPDKTIFIAFRGTDSSLIGWKENISLSYKPSILAQEYALNYTMDIASLYNKYKIRIGGHSKGGNLALYSSAYSSQKVQRRILGIYNFDGPGLGKNFYDSKEFESIKDVCNSFVPASSVIGLLFNFDKYTIIQSSKKGILQHDAFSWGIMGNKFITVNELTAYSTEINRAINMLLNSMSSNEIKKLTETFFSKLENSESMKESSEAILKKIIPLIKTKAKVDKETKDTLVSFVKEIHSID